MSDPPPQKFVQDKSCQVGWPIVMDNGASPDLGHMEVSIIPFRHVTFYHPPLPVLWIDAVGQFGGDSRNVMAHAYPSGN